MKITLESLIWELNSRGWAMDSIKPGDRSIIFEKLGFRYQFPMRDIPIYVLYDCLAYGPRQERAKE